MVNLTELDTLDFGEWLLQTGQQAAELFMAFKHFPRTASWLIFIVPMTEEDILLLTIKI